MKKIARPVQSHRTSTNPRAQLLMQHKKPNKVLRSQKRSWFLQKSGLIIASVISILIALGLYFKNDIQTYFQKELVVIEPEAGPIKIHPDHTSELSTPHREKTIYKSLEQDGLTIGQEKLLHKPEEPIMQNPVLADNFFENFMEPEAATDPLSTTSLNDADEPTIMPSLSYQVYHPYPLEQQKTDSLHPAHYIVHLTSPTNVDDVNMLIKRIQSNPELAPLILPYEKKGIVVDQGALHGVDYRLQIGPIQSLEEGRKICENLGMYGCIVIAQKN
ncbi:MAG: hypothetical protein ACTHJ4_03080 [Candidatus Nucleicultricaceae bacterium]